MLAAPLSEGRTGIYRCTAAGRGAFLTTNKTLIILNDSMTSAASFNIVSYYQMEQGVRGSTNTTTPSCYFWRYALADRLLMDINGNSNVGGTSVNTTYKLSVSGTLNCSSLYIRGSAADLSKLGLLAVTTNGAAEASKALTTDSSVALTGLRSLTVTGSGLNKSLIIQNDTTASAASMNFVSYYQCEMGVRGSSNTSRANQFFIKYALSDRLIMDTNGNVNIGGSSISTSYKLDVNGALNCSSLYVGGATADLSKLSVSTYGTAEASKALVTDASIGLTGLGSLTVVGSGLNKSLVVQNDTTSSAASMNFVSYYQMEQGVRGSANSTTPNCYFWRYALADRLLMDTNGNINIAGSSVNASYKVDVAVKKAPRPAAVHR